MPEQPRPVRGPLYVEATPIMVTLDASPLVSNNVHDLINLLRSNEFVDQFMELDTAGGLAFEELHAALVARLATKVRLTGKEAIRVGDRLAELGRERSIPEQRGEAA
ncbi:hypothetical protein [Streptomyces erythrochromogenes]|uniref:hypothetical protein n=1 Tax=Streptomyces erythrochromogenes TaxID=285574 RepID=UPI0022583DF2|nr:hypothetical protein [Streptomyces erythrochromogenes]MCX5587609.1 hypothetical protein [Streptomyces erythrochromogenes]